ncbi:MAG TPA: acyl-CoA dehydrogenase family protein, partial [Rhodothermales bacterium]|nr:acyl-CoA dehydrogenase family protein [Rhodothermales bacterium]
VRQSLSEVSVTLTEARQSFADFMDRYREKLHLVFAERGTADAMNLQRGLQPFVLNHLREQDPLSVYVPEAYGGRGAHLHEGLAMLEATGYESLPMCLTMGINGGLFLQPVAKYGTDEAKQSVLTDYLKNRRMGGLMITEPDYGSDALSMRTSWEQTPTGSYRVQGVKHWAGLTSWADYWLLTARARSSDGGLRRDVDFFICDTNQPGQRIVVEEMFPNLGLLSIPYGRNRIDVELPENRRLQPESSGVKMMLDVLHRSRLQFPGMAMGYLRRIMDEAAVHTRERFVGGKPLAAYDQVRARLARLQATVTACQAMCLKSAEGAGLEHDLTESGLWANAVKTAVTDFMQEAAQSFLTLVGARGYRQDHLAGRSTNDSRPFQIFEGSNDILYQQVTESVAKGMRKLKATNLGQYLAAEPLTARAASFFGDHLNFDIDLSLPQRKLVELGRVLSRIMTMEMTIELGERGYRADLIRNALEELRTEVRGLLETYRTGGLTAMVDDYRDGRDWLALARVSS